MLPSRAIAIVQFLVSAVHILEPASVKFDAQVTEHQTNTRHYLSYKSLLPGNESRIVHVVVFNEEPDIRQIQVYWKNRLLSTDSIKSEMITNSKLALEVAKIHLEFEQIDPHSTRQIYSFETVENTFELLLHVQQPTIRIFEAQVFKLDPMSLFVSGDIFLEQSSVEFFNPGGIESVFVQGIEDQCIGLVAAAQNYHNYKCTIGPSIINGMILVKMYPDLSAQLWSRETNFSTISAVNHERLSLPLKSLAVQQGVIICIDNSASMYEHIDKANKIAMSIVEALPAGAKFSIIVYNHMAQVLSPFLYKIDESTAKIARLLHSMRPTGGTSFTESMRFVYNMIPEQPNRNYKIVQITDGQIDESEANRSVQLIAEQTKRTNSHLSVINMGREKFSKRYSSMFAAAGKGFSFQADDLMPGIWDRIFHD